MGHDGIAHHGRIRMTVLVTVKAYPTVSDKYGEAVCVAGIRTDVIPHEWVRLFPVHFRDLPREQQFRKWEFIELEARRGSEDRRPESYRPILDTIQRGRFMETGKDWAERRWHLEPFLQPSVCGPGGVHERRRADNTSLAVIEPREVFDFSVEPRPVGPRANVA
ncbi:hypothetical protein FRAAL0142 [Frankia alni ACN14a]|uniref:Uncharacterized protein n=2 Tax=Frankiaceae TaxID=74712 RepID=Q0RUC1_FRAAA|nr:hypothetical protein FRAAL0142 [Frankia alni ACN14a]